MPRRLAAFALLAALFGASMARAQGGEPSAAEIAVARKLFSDASELERKKDYAAAEPKLREAMAIKETPGLRYHLGFCLEQQGKLVSALVEYDRAVELLEHGAKAPDVGELVGPARDGVRKRVAHVRVKLPKDVKDPSVEMDGSTVKPVLLSEPLPQDPGRHVLTVSAPGRQAFRQELDLDEAEARDVDVDLPALGKAVGTAKPAAATPSSDVVGDAGASGAPRSNTTRTVVLIGEGVFTVAALAVGIVSTRNKSHAEDQITAAHADLDKNGFKDSSVCGQSPVPTGAKEDCAQLNDFVDQRDSARRLQIIGFVGAGVGAAATVATFFLWKPAKSSQAAVHFAPLTGPGVYGLGAGGRF